MVRPLTVFSLFGVLAGCSGSVGGGADGGPQNIMQVIPQVSGVDVLFVIDDSAGMSAAQAALADGLPGLVDGLQSLPNGLPDLHIGVTTTSMGAGGFTQTVPNCGMPDAGKLVAASRAAADPSCATTNKLNANA